MQAWRRTHDGAYPERLADLRTAGLMPAEGALCPSVRQELTGADARHQMATSRKSGGDPGGLYEYELSPNVNKSQIERRWLPPDSRSYTRRDIKLELLRRPYAEQVAILRCSSHRNDAPVNLPGEGPPMRNLPFTGDAYWSGAYWELIWLTDVPYCARESIVLFGLKGPPFYVDQAPTLPAALDLRRWSCAFGDHPWWWTLPLFDERPNSQLAPDLKPFFQEQHGRIVEVGGEDYWLNGLTQLQGKVSSNNRDLYRQSAMQAFVWERLGLPVGRKLQRASWLQGTVWTAPRDDVVGWLIWHYADGQVERVPIIYGVQTARFWSEPQQIKNEEGYAEPAWKFYQAKETVGKERWLRIYKQFWENPWPDRAVETLDFVSNTNSPAAPFIVSINVFP